jgi:uncharacterized membrane protein (DUF106 family)
MGASEDLKKINAEIDSIRKELGKNPLQPFKLEDLEKAKESLAGLSAELREMSSDLDYISKSFRDSVNELSRQNTYLSDAKSSLRGIASISEKILEFRKGERSLSIKELNTLQQQAKAKFTLLQNSIKSGQITGKNLKEAQDSLDQQDKFNESLDRTIEINKQVNKEIGLLGNGIGGVSKLLSKMGFGDMSQPLQDAIDKTKNARLQQKLNNDEISKVSKELESQNSRQLSANQLRAGFGGKHLKSLQAQKDSLSSQNKELDGQTSKYKNIGNALKGQLTSFNAIDFVIMQLITAVLAVDKGAGDMAKNLNISYTQALDLQQEFARIANYSNDNAINTKRLGEALSAVNAELGTSGKLTEDELKTMVKLKEQSGLAYDTQVGLFKYAKSTGQEYEDSVISFQASAKAASYQKGVAVNTKQLMVDMNKVSNRTKLSIQGGATELAKSAVAAKLMGGNLSQVADIADQLLNFESSIENELSAELLTGKDLNLERARGLALNNDMAGLAEEITKQAGSAAEFGKMNRIQQEAIAKAVGMSADQLADTLVEQEALKSINKELDEDEKKAFEAAKEKYGVEEASKMLKDGQLDQMVSQQSTQEKFNDSLENMKEIFVTMAPALLTIGELLTNVLSVVGLILIPIQGIFDLFKFLGSYINVAITGLTKMFPVLKPLVSLFKGLASISVIYGAYLAYSALAGIPIVGPVLGGVAAAAVLAAGLGAISAIQVNDMVSPAPGGGYGKRTLMGPEGAIQLNDKDTVIAGTNLFGNDVKSEPGKATQMGNKGEIKVKSEGSDMSAVIAAINALASRPINVSTQIDGKEIATIQGKYPNQAGDANRVSSYKV